MTGGLPSQAKLVLVLDENIASEELRGALGPSAAANGACVELITDHFSRGTPDETWLPMAAARRWAVLTCDVQIRRRPAEKAILMSAGVSVFILRGALNGDQIRDALLVAVPAVCRKHRQLVPPVICHISREGQVTVIEGKRRGGIKR